ncbi:hypothetical protein PT974_02207 [Cladobotryum mycophilum]|uniref:Uncharacterized protein n=1 Tax=Cladobotryum mycophilum TaxID=491253 RepID=A0ABR0SXM3_9HYPO
MKSIFSLTVSSLALTQVYSSPVTTRDAPLPPAPGCDAEFSLVGATTERPNVPGAPFKATIACSSLDPKNVFVFVNGKEHNDFHVSGSEISFSNGLNSTSLLGIIAADTQGYPFVSSFSLNYGAAPTSKAGFTFKTQAAEAVQLPNPALHQCGFYETCVEDSVPCEGDPDSYAINYGLKNCEKFTTNLDLFSDRGNKFIWGTMNCLQKDLVPVVSDCDATCKSIHDAAFGSHAQCYLANGFCSLKCSDYLAELYTVGLDLFTKDAIKSAFQTAGGCLGKIEEIIEEGACMNDALKKIVLTILNVLAQ